MKSRGVVFGKGGNNALPRGPVFVRRVATGTPEHAGYRVKLSAMQNGNRAFALKTLQTKNHAMFSALGFLNEKEPPISPKTLAELVPMVGFERYLPRQLVVTGEAGKASQCSDEEIHLADGPVIILGEPGIGKSRLAKQLAERTGGLYVDARGIDDAREPLRLAHTKPVIIDGINEMARFHGANQIDALLRWLVYNPHPNIVLTCRSADWMPVCAEAITDRWLRRPTVLTLLPFTDQGVREYIDENAPSVDSHEFMGMARKHGIGSALGNPVTLPLLICVNLADNWLLAGWPPTKTALYDRACELLAETSRVTGGAGASAGLSTESRVDLAGLVCAHLLLAGRNRIALTGTHSNALPRDRLAVTTGDDGDLDAVLSSALFRLREDSRSEIEPISRCIAEYLAGRWLVRSVESKEIDIRSVEKLLRVSEGTVPPSLRGVHAWVVTLGGDSTREFAVRDPSGLWCYGDRDALADCDWEAIFANMEDASDPADRRVMGLTSFTSWSQTLRRRRIQLIRAPNTSELTARLVCETLVDTSAPTGEYDRLIDIVLDPKAHNREACLDVLFARRPGIDLDSLLERMLKLKDHVSVVLCLRIARQDIRGIGGGNFVRALCNVEMFGSGNDIQRDTLDLMEHGELIHGMSTLEKIIGEKPKWRQVKARGLIVPILNRLARLDWSGSGKLWSMLKHARRTWRHEADWEPTAAKYFSSRPDLRIEIQREFIESATNGKVFESLRRLGDTCRPLGVTGADIQEHMQEMEEKRPRGWMHVWGELVRYGKVHAEMGHFIAHARRQVARNPSLSTVLEDVLKSRRHRSMEEAIACARARQDASRQEQIKFRESCRAGRTVIRTGEDIPSLRVALDAYFNLSRARNYGDGSPRDRVAHVMGADLVPDVLAGVEAAVFAQGDKMSAWGIATQSADWKFGDHALLLLTLCLERAQSGRDFDDLSVAMTESAVAAFHMNPWVRRHAGHGDALSRLERTVFAGTGAKEGYLRAIVEPFFLAGEDLPPGVDRLLLEEAESKSARKIALEWLGRDSAMSRKSRACLLTVLLEGNYRKEIRLLLRRHKVGGVRHGEMYNRFLFGLAFTCDFANQCGRLREIAKHDKRSVFSVLRPPVYTSRIGYWDAMSPEQNHFLVSTYAPMWPRTGAHWVAMSEEGREPWKVSDFLLERIRALGNDTSDEAGKMLRKLLKSGIMGGYSEAIRTAKATQDRLRKEMAGAPLEPRVIRHLLGASPRTAGARGHPQGLGRQRVEAQ